VTTAAEKICDVLIEAEIDHVFGIPGGGTIPIWDALYDRQDRIRTILVRHEQVASCMADMYGRLTGKPGVLMGQGAFIGSGGSFGVLEGYLSSSPMLVLTDFSDMGNFGQHGIYQSGTGEYGSFDLLGIFRSMSKYSTHAATPGEAVQGVQLAIKHATSGRPGPACVVMRNNAISGEIDPDRVPKIYPTDGYLRTSPTIAPDEEVERAVNFLMEAKSPVIIAGNGVHISRAYHELKEIAELMGIPVTTSYKGKSTFAETHPLALGIMGTFGQRVANNVVADADLLLVAGCRLSPSDTRYESPQMIAPPRQKIIQIDIDPRNAGWTFPVDMALIGDVKSVLRQIIEVVQGEGPARAKERTEALQQRKRAGKFFEAPELHSDDSPLLPQRIVSEINKVVDPSTIITFDAGDNRYWMSHFFKSKEVRTTFCPGGIAGMGWGPAAALAAKLLEPRRPVLSVSGDGGFAMVIHVLSTGLQYNLPIAFLVMNNSGLGAVRDAQMGRKIATDFVETNFARIAEAFDCRGVRVDEPGKLAPALEEALGANVSTVVDVITSQAEPFFKIASF
jgi:acetolactate synthase-1/2/3 large subunit